ARAGDGNLTEKIAAARLAARLGRGRHIRMQLASDFIAEHLLPVFPFRSPLGRTVSARRDSARVRANCRSAGAGSPAWFAARALTLGSVTNRTDTLMGAPWHTAPQMPGGKEIADPDSDRSPVPPLSWGDHRADRDQHAGLHTGSDVRRPGCAQLGVHA